MYCIQAVIATDPVLRQLASTAPEARIVTLAQGLSLVPVTDALIDVLADAGASEPDGPGRTFPGLDPMMAACSIAGLVAYVEAEYFGGTGSQTAQVWDAGEVVLGPLHLAEGEPSPTTGTPISQALRQLGATKGDHFDEFDAIGLGRHRDTDDWLSPTS